MLLLLAVIPALLWDEGPGTAAQLEKAGIHEIATTKDAAAWAGTRVRAVAVDGATLEHLGTPGVENRTGRAGATSDPWVDSNLWRELSARDRSYVYDVSGPSLALAAVEAYVSGARAYLRVKAEDLKAFASTLQFLRQIDGPALPPRANFGLVNDGSPEMGEVMNLLVRRNLLFEPVRNAADWKGSVVRVGSGQYTRERAANPYEFAAVVRSQVGDDRRLVRLYGSNTTIARMSGSPEHSRLHLIQYGRRPVTGMRVRVLGKYWRVLVAAPEKRVMAAVDVITDSTATEFTIPQFQTYAVVDLDATAPGVLNSVHTARDFALNADPRAPEWRGIRPLKLNRDAFGEPTSSGVTEVRSRWSDTALYLMYTCPYRELNLKPEPVTDRETPKLWDWDVAEAFIGADDNAIGQYREYQVSPQGEWVDLDIDVLAPKPEGGMLWNSGFEVKARIDREAKIWYGEMRIPLASIAARPLKGGDRLRLGLFRISGAGPDQKRELTAWQPMFRRNFHVPEAFGNLVLSNDNQKQ